MSAQPIREEQVYKDNVIQFRQKNDVKLKKDGTPKQTPNNTKRNRDDIQPIKEEDIPKMVKWLREFRDSSNNDEDYQIRFRNLTMFIMGINIALRVSDLISLRWSDIYDNNWEFLDGKKIVPKKTAKKRKHVLLAYNNSFRRAISEYKEYINPKKLDSYIFTSRQNPSGHIGAGTVEKFIKTMAEELEITYSINTHSMRKTFARIRYEYSDDKTRTLLELMQMFRHSSPDITLGYICIKEKEIKDLFYAVELGYDEE